MTKNVYLRSDVYFEPLFNKWYMWPHLLAPAPAAMQFSNHHLKLMKSFVANAKIHARSAKNKALAGSSLVDVPVERVDDVKRLIDKSLTEHADLLEFARAVKALDQMLHTEADGMSLEPLYARIPDTLRGLVELHYDLNNQPSFRFIEGLLYQSPFYKHQAQAICLGVLKSAERPFVLSTPRLPDENHLHINVPLNHPFVDALFRLRDVPQPLRHVRQMMKGLEIEGELDVDSLFTTKAPEKPSAYKRDAIKIRYLGHAGLLIETDSSVLMVDPVIAYRNDDEQHKTTFDAIPDSIDIVMVTHTHMDHLCLETLIQLKHKIKTVLVPKSNSGHLADPSIKLMLRALGFTNVVEMEDMESHSLDDGYLLSLPFLGEHADVSIRSKAAWFIEVKGQKILAAADSSNLDEYLYKKLHAIVGDVDVLFIGMECTGGPLRWLYGPLLTRSISREQNESRRFNGSDYKAASYMAKTFNADRVYVYALGVERWFGYFMGISYNDDDIQLVESRKLVDECRARQVEAEQLSGLKILELPAKREQRKEMMF